MRGIRAWHPRTHPRTCALACRFIYKHAWFVSVPFTWITHVRFHQNLTYICITREEYVRDSHACTHARRHTHACTHVPIYHSARFYCLYYLVSELSFSSFLLGPTVLIYLRSQISTFYLSFSSYNVREERKVNCCGFTDGLKQVLLSTSFKLRGFSLEREKIVGFTLLRYTIVLRNSRPFPSNQK